MQHLNVPVGQGDCKLSLQIVASMQTRFFCQAKFIEKIKFDFLKGYIMQMMFLQMYVISFIMPAHCTVFNNSRNIKIIEVL